MDNGIVKVENEFFSFVNCEVHGRRNQKSRTMPVGVGEGREVIEMLISWNGGSSHKV